MYNAVAFTAETLMDRHAEAPTVEISEVVYCSRRNGTGDTRCGPASARISSGEWFSLIGPADGRGRSMLRLIAGLEFPQSGEVRISGARADQSEECVGIVFEEPSLLDWRTALDNVLLQCELRGLDPRVKRSEALRLFALMGIEEFAHRRPQELTIGIAQRIAICRALIHAPTLLLMDNPSRPLDGLDREQLGLDLQRLQLTPKITTVFYTSCIDEAVLLSDRIAVMDTAGRVTHTVTVELPRPRRMDKETTPRIAEYSGTIRTYLHAGGVLS